MTLALEAVTAATAVAATTTTVVAVAIGMPRIHGGAEGPAPAAAIGSEGRLVGHSRGVRVCLGDEKRRRGQTLLTTTGGIAALGRGLRAVRRLQVGALLDQHAVRHHVGLHLRGVCMYTVNAHSVVVVVVVVVAVVLVVVVMVVVVVVAVVLVVVMVVVAVVVVVVVVMVLVVMVC